MSDDDKVIGVALHLACGAFWPVLAIMRDLDRKDDFVWLIALITEIARKATDLQGDPRVDQAFADLRDQTENVIKNGIK